MLPVLGPLILNYNFTVNYEFSDPQKEYKDIVQERILLGYSIKKAGEGLPLSYGQLKYMAKNMNKPDKQQIFWYKKHGNGSMDTYAVYDDYMVNKVSICKIADKINVHRSYVSRILKQCGVNCAEERKTRKYPDLGKYWKENPPKGSGNLNLTKRRMLVRFRRKLGPILDPVYADIEKGMTARQACEKHGVCRTVLWRNLKTLQTKYGLFLDYGKRKNMTLRLSVARIEQFNRIARLTHNNVLDWASDTLKSVCDQKEKY